MTWRSDQQPHVRGTQFRRGSKVSYATAIAADGPQGWWRLSEASGDFADSGAANKTLTSSGTAYQYSTPGIVGNCVTNPVGGSYAMSPASGDFGYTIGTIEAWIRTANAGASYCSIIAKQNSYSMFLQDNILVAYDWVAGTPRASTRNLADSQWHHVAFAFRSGVSSGSFMYVDGVLALTTDYTVGSFNAKFNLNAGSDAGGQIMTGDIDEPAVYNYQLSPAQILNHYRVGASII